MERRLLVLVVIALLAVGAAACSGDDGGEATTTSFVGLSSTTTTTATSPTGGGGTDDTTTTVFSSEGSLPEYEIVRRDPGESGDTVVAIVDSTGTLTDIDLQNLVADIVDRFPPVYEAHIVDSTEAAALVLEPEPDDAQRAVLAQHYLVRLEEGFRIVFTGPFETSGSTVLGS